MQLTLVLYLLQLLDKYLTNVLEKDSECGFGKRNWNFHCPGHIALLRYEICDVMMDCSVTSIG
jgi:hypothetical protein